MFRIPNVFKVDSQNTKLPLIEAHYDSHSMTTKYVKSTISKSIATRQTACGKQFDMSFYGKDHDMDNIYDRLTSQNTTFENLFECMRPGATKKCKYYGPQKYYFDRGHLTPKSSQVYIFGCMATFVYLNTAPQWRTANGGNWAAIEVHANHMATTLGVDLDVYTGVMGKLELPDLDANNVPKEVFLSASNEEKIFPVPLYFWKIIFEPPSKRGVAYITVNNPHLSGKNLQAFKACKTPIMFQEGVQMPNWNLRDLIAGHSYMCDVNDLIEHKDFPEKNFPRVTGFLSIQKRGYNPRKKTTVDK